ncbi:MAG: type II toxin-antitoxin system PemK/MazF family toxin [Planctomycetota bacterium]|jgi:mRNA-degrading endonuclease toxin of MazEF toxin-antitoxin module
MRVSAQRWYPLPGHIIRTEVPRTDSDLKDVRFPVVVSTRSYNRQFGEVIVAYTTRSINIRHPRGYDVEISDKHPGFNATGLTQNTTVRCGRLHTVKQQNISDVIGSVPGDLLGDIQRLVVECFQESGQTSAKA